MKHRASDEFLDEEGFIEGQLPEAGGLADQFDAAAKAGFDEPWAFFSVESEIEEAAFGQGDDPTAGEAQGQLVPATGEAFGGGQHHLHAHPFELKALVSNFEEFLAVAAGDQHPDTVLPTDLQQVCDIGRRFGRREL